MRQDEVFGSKAKSKAAGEGARPTLGVLTTED